ncbi:MAG: hypothetical protein RDU24_11040 [Humidesulfovibrio sp.]|uniref:hypothetical protein n=1 Tax=Humidesulfovibrio sp. TaxID=2910988 RepID=UPI0027F12B58|nr:hypothetical protein [Humidesulfovibrio sp.]MDQ7835906.1 hypothetical protein [Humidesulfovibrio sp.]
MRGAWYIVDVYSFTCIVRAAVTAIQDKDNSTLLVITAVALMGVLFLSWQTYRGSRFASRLLALYIIANVVSNVWPYLVGAHRIDVYSMYWLVFFAYLFGGAIKLWRIKELPTRFTDPPAEPPAHA